MKRKREASLDPGPHEVVAAALAGDVDRLTAALEGTAEEGKRATQRRRARLAAKRATKSFAGCSPLAAAVLGNSPACIKLLAAQVDVNQHQQGRLDADALRSAFPHLPSCACLELAFPRGGTPLTAALRLALFSAAEALLEAGADPNAAELLCGDTPLVALNSGLMVNPRYVKARLDASSAPLAMLRTLLAGAALLQLLAVAARHGSPEEVQDVLSLGADPSAPAAARACLLAQAAMQTRAEAREVALAALLAAGAQLRVEDLVCCVVQQAVGALRCLLRISRPRPDPGVPYVTVESYVVTLLGDCLDMAEELGQASYSPSKYAGPDLRRVRSWGVNWGGHPHGARGDDGDEEAGAPLLPAQQGQQAPQHGQQQQQQHAQQQGAAWRYDPLQDDPPCRFAAAGANRLLMFALERLVLGPDTLARFPTRLRAAVRAVLLIAAHGRVVRNEEELTIEQLALLCCYRRQQLYRQLDEAEEAAAAARNRGTFLPALVRSKTRRLRAWAEERGWEPLATRQQHSLRQAGTAGILSGDGTGGGIASSSGAGSGSTAAGPLALALPSEPQVQATGRQRMAALLELRRVSREKEQAALALSAPELHQLQATEARLEARLINGALAGLPQGLPLAPHPLRRLPPELVLRILQMAAYPLSAWTDVADFRPAAEEREAGGLQDDEALGLAASPPPSP
ncbi:hypothetical protein ABPG75_008948 [Micractinium tetrahymenae]